MRKKRRYGIMILLSVLLFLTACEKEQDTVGEPEAKNGFSVSETSIIADTEDGVYFCEMSQDNFIYYWDFSQNQCVYLCGKADCAHNSEECNAWFEGLLPYTLEIYQGKLYLWAYSSAQAVLYRMDLDGSNRTEICRCQSSDGKSGVPNFSKLYNGYCYMRAALGTGPNGHDLEGVYRQSLNGEKDAELIYIPDTEDGWIHRLYGLRTDDGYVYFEDLQYREEERKCEIFQYDIASGKLDVIYTSNNYASFVKADNKLIFSENAMDGKGFTTTCVMDLESGSVEKLMDVGGNLTYDGEYLYVITSNNTIAVYNLEGTQIDLFEHGFEGDMEYDIIQMLTSESYLYGWGEIWEEGDSEINTVRYIYHLYDKSDIGKKEHSCRTAEFEQIIQGS